MQAEQVAGRPAEVIRLRAPAGEEGATVLDRVLPAAGLDVRGAAGLKGLEDPCERLFRGPKLRIIVPVTPFP